MDKKSNPHSSERKLSRLLVLSASLLLIFCLGLYVLGGPSAESPDPSPSQSSPAPVGTVSPSPGPSSSGLPNAPETPSAAVPESPDPAQEFGPTDHSGQAQTNQYDEEGVTYENEGYFSYEYDEYGAFLCVGVNLDSEARMIYLNPMASVTGFPDAKIGFYITASRCDLQYSAQQWQSRTEGENPNHQYFVIDWTYDELMPADYVDGEHYGVGWKNDILADGKTGEGAEIYIRAVDLSNRNKLLTVGKATIGYDAQDKTYRLVSLENMDVASTGIMTAEDRAELLSRAYDLASSKMYFPNKTVASALTRMGTKEEALSKAIVEYLGDRTYFPQMADVSGFTKLSSSFTSRFSNIFAVTIPVRVKGFITMYYSPDALTMDVDPLDKDNESGMDLSPVTDNWQLNFFGTDFYNPEHRGGGLF